MHLYEMGYGTSGRVREADIRVAEQTLISDSHGISISTELFLHRIVSIIVFNYYYMCVVIT